jgi:hypothetical protein
LAAISPHMNLKTFIIFIIFIVSTPKLISQEQKQYLSLDFIGDKDVDSLLINTVMQDGKILKEIYFLKSKHWLLKKRHWKYICTIMIGRSDSEIFSVENFVDSSSNEKGLRLISNDTSFIPNIYYLEIAKRKRWEIIRMGKINTNESGDLENCKVPFLMKDTELLNKNKMNETYTLDAIVIRCSKPELWECR